MNGHIVSGLGAAARLLQLQKPLLRDFLPGIEDCKIGTINVQLNHALDIRIPDIVTPPLQWEPSSNVGERFGFTSVKLELFEKQHDAWIYGAEFSIQLHGCRAYRASDQRHCRRPALHAVSRKIHRLYRGVKPATGAARNHRHSGMRRRDKIAKLFCAEVADLSCRPCGRRDP